MDWSSLVTEIPGVEQAMEQLRGQEVAKERSYGERSQGQNWCPSLSCAWPGLTPAAGSGTDC